MKLWNVHLWSYSNSDRTWTCAIVLTDLALSKGLSYTILRSPFQPKQFWQPDTRRKNALLTEFSLSGYVRLQQNLQLHPAAWEGTAFTIAKHVLQIKTGNVVLSYSCRTAVKTKIWKIVQTLIWKKQSMIHLGSSNPGKKVGPTPEAWGKNAF